MMTTARGGADRWLAVVRIAVGLWFLKAVVTKVGLVWYGGVFPFLGANERFLGFHAKRVAGWAASPEVPGFYRAFLEGVVVPNAAVFAHLQTLGELAAGLGLVLGLFTPWAAGLALFLTLNYAIVTFNESIPSQGLHFLLVVCLAAVIGGRAGLRFGVDGWRKGPRPGVTFA